MAPLMEFLENFNVIIIHIPVKIPSCIFPLFLCVPNFVTITPASDRAPSFYCATQICIARTCYGDVAGWLAGWVSVRHTPVLYQNG